MSRPLIPCPACNRHVFVEACTCPFCQAALSPDRCAKVHQAPAGQRRMSRAARVAAGAALLGAACSTASAYGTAAIVDGGPDAPADHAEAGSDGAAGQGGAAGRGAGGVSGGGAGGKTDAGPDGGVVPLYGAAAPVPRKPGP